MNSPRTQELDKLRDIATRVAAIEDRVTSRIPHQRAQLAALVAAHKWRLQTLYHQRRLTHEACEAMIKRLRREIGAFEYGAKEPSELLTRHLCELDNILSYGNSEVKEARKALVVRIQELLRGADAAKDQATRFKAFADRILDSIAIPAAEELPEQADVPMTAETVTSDCEADLHGLFSDAEEVEEQFNETAVEMPEPEPEDDKQDLHEEMAATEGIHDESMEDDEDEATDDDSDDENDDSDDDSDDDNQVDANESNQYAEDAEDANVDTTIDPRSLPIWRPYYQIQKRQDGVYMLANLAGVDPRHLRVECSSDSGVLRISGIKLPTQKDLILSRFTSVPTFGRFEIAERFPVEMLNLDSATQQFTRDGTLQIRLPYYFVRHPRILRRASPFQPYRCMVW